MRSAAYPGNRQREDGTRTIVFGIACVIAAAALYLSYMGMIASSPFVD